MIATTRLNDSQIIINADLIETIESTPDTVITLIDGTRFIVRESPEDIVQQIQRYRAGILQLRDDPELGTPEPPSTSKTNLRLLEGEQ